MKKTGNSKKSRTRISERAKRILTVCLAAAVIILIVLTAAQKLGNMTISTFTSDVKTYFMSLGSGDGYPYSIDSNRVKSISVNKSNLILLLDDKTTALTSSAKEIMPNSHTCNRGKGKLCRCNLRKRRSVRFEGIFQKRKRKVHMEF